MGRRGPPRKPTALKIAEGNPGGKKLNTREPKPPAAVPTCPASLKGPARVEWHRVVHDLYRLDLMTKIDMAALHGYCYWYGRACKLSDKLEKEGDTYQTDKGNYVQHPLVSQVRNAWLMCHKFAVEFGMTPAARSRIEVDVDKEDSEDDDDEKDFFSPSG